MNKVRRIVGVSIVASLATAGYWYVVRGASETADGQRAFAGNVDIRDVTLAFRVPGRVEAVLVQEGVRVEPGQLVARLDDAPYRASLEQARAGVEVARAQLVKAEAGSRREDITESRSLLQDRKAARARAEDNFQRTERLRSSGTVSEQDLVVARANRDQAEAAVQAAQAGLRRVTTGTRAEDIAIARAQLEQAEAAVSMAEVTLRDAELRAPTAGIVVTRALEPGAIVAAGSPVLVIAFDDPVWIRAFAPQPDLADLAPGTLVHVHSDGRPDAPFVGRIGYVAAQAEFTPKNVETAELRTSLVYRFRVIVEAHDGGLRQGMPVTVVLPPESSTTGEIVSRQP